MYKFIYYKILAYPKDPELLRNNSNSKIHKIFREKSDNELMVDISTNGLASKVKEMQCYRLNWI